MVQRKLGTKASTSLGTDKKPSTNMKPSIQNHDSKPRGAELSKKMKKSRSFKRSSDSESLKKPSVRRYQLSDQPQKQPPCSPMKQSPVLASPNYMKSTSSSEARKEQRQVQMKTPSKSMVESASKSLLSAASSPSTSSVASHKLLSRSLSRTSSLKKVRTLTKAPSFKPSRSTISVNKCSKAALCGDLDVKRATCSTILKDSKFPPFLDLNPGGTESEGTSVMKVCPYNYCSLNGHRHNSAPPLKSFLSARRRIMKAQRSVKPVAAALCEAKPCKDDGEGKENLGVDLVVVNETEKPVPLCVNEEKPDFFIEVYSKEREDKAESDSVEPTGAEVGFEDNHDQERKTDFGKSSSGGVGVDGGNFDWESSTSISLDELFAKCSDMEWEEERLYLTGLEMEDGISTPLSDQEIDNPFEHPSGNEILCLLDEEVLKKDDVNVEFFKEFLAEESVEFSQDEIIDCHEQFCDSESSTCDVFQVTEIDQFLQDHGFPGDCNEMLVASAANEDLTEESPAFHDETTEASATEDEISEETPKEQPPSVNDSEALDAVQELPLSGQADEDTPLIDMENSGFTKQASPDSEEEGDSNLKKLIEVKNITQTVEATEEEELDRSASEEEQPQADNKSSGNSDGRKYFKEESSLNHDLSNNCNDFNIIIGTGKRGKDSEALKSFNPREPNYLEVEADPEAEKVDLRHQEMDERRNSEEWMLDYALRKAVNQLGPARKKKVALLVEAFETVIPPVHNCETRARPISSAFARIQACN